MNAMVSLTAETWELHISVVQPKVSPDTLPICQKFALSEQVFFLVPRKEDKYSVIFIQWSQVEVVSKYCEAVFCLPQQHKKARTGPQFVCLQFYDDAE